VGRGLAVLVGFGRVRSVSVWYGLARLGGLGKARSVRISCGTAWRVKAVLAWFSSVRRGMLRSGVVWRSGQGETRNGEAWFGGLGTASLVELWRVAFR